MKRMKLLKSWLSIISLVVLTAVMTACGGSGSVTLPGTINTAAVAAGNVTVPTPTGVTLSIPAGTTFTDTSGNPVTGAITTSVTYATTADALTAAEKTPPPDSVLAAYVDISMGTVKHFSKSISLAINVPTSVAKSGDTMTVYSFDGTQWNFEGTAIVDSNGNITPTVTHLSIWGVFKTHAPAQPSGVQTTAGDTQVTVNWSALTGATSYNIYYGTTAGVTTSTGTKIANATSPGAITGLTNGTTYYFVVTAVNIGGESAVSNEATATPVVAPPTKPAGILLTPGDGKVTVNWTTVTGNTYNIYYGTSAGVTTTSGTKVANATSGQVISGLTNGTTYYFVVTAVNTGSESGVSSEKSAAPAAVLQVPASPNGRVVTATVAGQINVSWTAVSNTASYNVYYLQSASLPTNAQVLAGPKQSSSTASLTLTGLTSGATYNILITAVNTAGESGTQTKALAITVL